MLSCMTVGMLCLLFGCLMLTGHSSASRAPKLNIKAKEIVIHAGQPLHLTCSGEENVFWKFSAVLGKDSKRLHITQNVCEGHPKKVCRRRLTLRKAQINDTGFYSCELYSSFKRPARRDLSTSIYVFITEPNTPFVEMHRNIPGVVRMIEGEELVVPCRTTSPNITVTFKKMNSGVLKADGQNIIWDYKRGFIIPKPTYRFIDLLSCEATVNGSVHSTKYIIIRLTSAIHSMQLNVSSSIRLLTGNSLSINCTVTADLNSRPEIQWEYPGLKKRKLAFIINRMDRSNPKSITFYSILFIDKVQRIDEGQYICAAKNGQLTKSVNTTVRIHAKPFINAKPKHKGILEAVAGQKSYRISVKVRAFPSPEVRWLKDDLLAADKCARYIVGDNHLIIKDVAGEDAGIYTISLHLKEENLTKNLSMRLIVNVKPQIYEKSVSFQESHLYPLGSKQTLRCTVFGVPAPTITWMWHPCPPNDSKAQCDVTTKNDLPVILGKNSSHLGNKIQSLKQRTQIIEGKNKTASILVIEESKASGVYTCVATNKIGSERRHIRYYVTDIPNGFHVSLNKEPAEGEDLILSCSVNKYLYTDISWTLLRKTGNRTMHHSISKQRDAVTTEYSTTLVALIKNATHADSGSYSCRGKNIYTGEVIQQVKEIAIKGDNCNKKTSFSRTSKLKRRKSNCTTESSGAH
ncbi:vascular endothelial growth factor receptor 1 [Spea bombifrons]|uniref:vascular endothelial growth factor receptor 1 n=1 Tax=Spea bombifrons TaxID=233779 RepID=UPI00234A7AB6|nr:vascular endothelial growth factor receptor 1 [Spea bombifrons]